MSASKGHFVEMAQDQQWAMEVILYSQYTGAGIDTERVDLA